MDYRVSIGNANLSYPVTMKRFFVDHLPGGVERLNGMKGSEAVPVIANALFEINKTKVEQWSGEEHGDDLFVWTYSTYSTGGTIIGAILFLSLIMGECAMNPDAVIRVE